MESFSLLTLNCFGAPAPGTSARLERLAHLLNEAEYSMICLQEVQAHPYRRLIGQICGTNYPTQTFEPFVHAPMGGLFTLSKFALKDSSFLLFQNRGLWYTPALADWILHKGILITTTSVRGVPITVLNTHLTANYTGSWTRTNPYARQELDELMQIANVVNSRPPDELVIVSGDFNIPRGSWLYHSLLSAAKLTDPLSGDNRPTFRPHVVMGHHYAAAIDFTLYRPPQGQPVQVQSELAFTEKVRIGDRMAYLSDHLAIETRFSWAP